MGFEIIVQYDVETNQYDLWVSSLEKMPLLLELREIVEEPPKEFLKSFEITLRVVEEENKIYGSMKGVDHAWEKHYKTLNGGTLFVLVHSMADYIDAVKWTFIVCGGQIISNN